jgi:hypothetical protein
MDDLSGSCVSPIALSVTSNEFGNAGVAGFVVVVDGFVIVVAASVIIPCCAYTSCAAGK